VAWFCVVRGGEAAPDSPARWIGGGGDRRFWGILERSFQSREHFAENLHELGFEHVHVALGVVNLLFDVNRIIDAAHVPFEAVARSIDAVGHVVDHTRQRLKLIEFRERYDKSRDPFFVSHSAPLALLEPFGRPAG